MRIYSLYRFLPTCFHEDTSLGSPDISNSLIVRTAFGSIRLKIYNKTVIYKIAVNGGGILYFFITEEKEVSK